MILLIFDEFLGMNSRLTVSISQLFLEMNFPFPRLFDEIAKSWDLTGTRLAAL